jgi:nitrogen fixation protein FixH
MQPRDKWIPWYFVVFFVVLIVIDGTMVTIAVKTQTGTITDHPYEKGLAYNQVVKDSDMQAALGWKGNIDFKDGEISFTLKDKTGHAISADKVLASFTRPTQAGMDFTQPMQISEGTYFILKPAFPVKGLWEVRVYVESKAGQFQHSKRIVVQ